MKNKLFAYVTVALLLAVGAAAVVTPLNGEDSSADTTAVGLSVGQTKTVDVMLNETAFTGGVPSWSYTIDNQTAAEYGASYGDASKKDAGDYSFYISNESNGKYTAYFIGETAGSAHNLTLTYKMTVTSGGISTSQTTDFVFTVTVATSVTAVTLMDGSRQYGTSTFLTASMSVTNTGAVTATSSSFVSGSTYYLFIGSVAYKMTASSETNGEIKDAYSAGAITDISISYLAVGGISETWSLTAGAIVPTATVTPSSEVANTVYYVTGLFDGVASSTAGQVSGALPSVETATTEARIMLVTVYASDTVTGGIQVIPMAIKYSITNTVIGQFTGSISTDGEHFSELAKTGTPSTTAVSGSTVQLKFDQSLNVKIVDSSGNVTTESPVKDAVVSINTAGTGEYVITADNGVYTQTYVLFVIDDLTVITASIHVKCA